MWGCAENNDLDSDSENDFFSLKNLTSSHHLKGYFSKFSCGGACPQTPLVSLGYQLRALQQQNNLGETLYSKDFGRVGQTISVLAEAENRTK